MDVINFTLYLNPTLQIPIQLCFGYEDLKTILSEHVKSPKSELQRKTLLGQENYLCNTQSSLLRSRGKCLKYLQRKRKEL